MKKIYLKPKAEGVLIEACWALCETSIHSGSGSSGQGDPTPGPPGGGGSPAPRRPF